MKPQYKRMLNLMEAKEKALRRKKQGPWFLYILECSDGSLYTGVTKDLEHRLKTHQTGRASRFTRTRLPVKLCYRESCLSRTQALVREYAVKKLPRHKKEALVESQR